MFQSPLFYRGEFVLKKAERAYNKDNVWSPSEVIFLITNDPKYDLFKKLKHHLFKDFITKTFEPADMCLTIPLLNFKIRFEQLSSNMPYEKCFMATNNVLFGNNGPKPNPTMTLWIL